jgi:hypothetical protein
MAMTTTCKQEVIAAADFLLARTGRGEFALGELVAEMRRAGTRYSERSIRTHVASLMCVNAPKNFAVTYPHFERVSQGVYRPYQATGEAPSPSAEQPARRLQGSQKASRPVPAKRTTAAERRMRERVDALIAGFGGYLAAFSEAESFTGPSVYFHLRTLELLRTHASPVDALGDQRYLDSLYATLASWGMHRMGPRGAKMRSMAEFREGFQAQRSAIALVQRLELQRLAEDEAVDVADHVWSIVDGLTIGVGATKIVAGSKALHHLLPGLVPPIDRQYTLRFFYGNKLFAPGDQARMIRTMFPLFREIAVACAGPIADALAHPTSPMDNSVTKVIDNAIVGYCLRELGGAPATE